MNAPAPWAIALDVGGTALRSALVAADGELAPGWPRVCPIDAKAAAPLLLEAFAGALRSPLEEARAASRPVAGIGIAMPGPFDYPRGISLIRGLDKFDAIYGINLREELRRALALEEEVPIRFQVDAWMFLLGEVWRGEARGFSRAIGLTLGSGLGSAFFADGSFLAEEVGLPYYGWIGCLPLGAGLLEDRISRRGIIARYAELGREPAGDVEQIAARASAGEPEAARVFAETGEILGEALRPLAQAFGAQVLVLGGQVSKSFPLFSGPLLERLRSAPTLVKIAPTREFERSSLRGAAQLVLEGFPGALACLGTGRLAREGPRE
jgi:glucokinase